jgi:hypothetical protein
MKKKKQPGKKPTEAEFTYYDSKYVDSSFDMKELVEEGYIYASAETDRDGYGCNVYVYGDDYLHEDEFKKAVANWESEKEKWDSWLQTDEGKAWLVEQAEKQAEKEAKRKSKAKEEVEKKIQNLERELKKLKGAK